MVGFDASEYAIATAKEEVRPHLSVRRAEEPFPYADQRFGEPKRPDLEFVVLEKHLLSPDAKREGRG